jgi:hypothetical protein
MFCGETICSISISHIKRVIILVFHGKGVFSWMLRILRESLRFFKFIATRSNQELLCFLTLIYFQGLALLLLYSSLWVKLFLCISISLYRWNFRSFYFCCLKFLIKRTAAVSQRFWFIYYIFAFWNVTLCSNYILLNDFIFSKIAFKKILRGANFLMQY